MLRRQNKALVPGLSDAEVACALDAMRANARRTAPPALLLACAQPRARLVTWMAAQCARLALGDECLFLAANYVDRFLAVSPRFPPPSSEQQQWGALRTLGAAALLIADKYESVAPHSAAEYARLTGVDAGIQHVRTAELVLLNALAFDVCVATPLAFLRYAAAADVDIDARGVSVLVRARRVCRRSLRTSAAAAFSAAHLGFACWLVARAAHTLEPWPPHLARATRTTAVELAPCAAFLGHLTARPQKSRRMETAATTPVMDSLSPASPVKM